MLRDLPHERFAVRIWHPIAWFDLLFVVNSRLKTVFQCSGHNLVSFAFGRTKVAGIDNFTCTNIPLST